MLRILNPTYSELVVAVISLAASLFVVYLGRRSEHAKWIRQERLVAYSAFLGCANGLLVQIGMEAAPPEGGALSGKQRDKFIETVSELYTRLHAVHLLASLAIGQVSQRIVEELAEATTVPAADTLTVLSGVGHSLDEFVRLAKRDLHYRRLRDFGGFVTKSFR